MGIQSLMLSQWPCVFFAPEGGGKGRELSRVLERGYTYVMGKSGGQKKRPESQASKMGQISLYYFTLLFHQNKIPQCPSNNDGGLAIQ